MFLNLILGYLHTVHLFAPSQEDSLAGSWGKQKINYLGDPEGPDWKTLDYGTHSPIDNDVCVWGGGLWGLPSVPK